MKPQRTIYTHVYQFEHLKGFTIDLSLYGTVYINSILGMKENRLLMLFNIKTKAHFVIYCLNLNNKKKAS